MRIGKFFTDVLGAKLANTRSSWGACRRDFVFLRVWEHGRISENGGDRIQIMNKNWSPPSRGFDGYKERKRHIEMLRNGAHGFGVLCAAKDPTGNGTRTIKHFDDKFLLKFGDLVEDEENVFARIEKRIGIDDLKRAQTGNSTLAPDIAEIRKGQWDKTTKEALVDARIGQGKFRAEVLLQWNNKCCVTGCETLDAIRASHIKPWRESNHGERLDAFNGLPLIATLDALFDAGLISFGAEGELLVSNRLSGGEKELLGLQGLRLKHKPPDVTARYLAYHCQEIFY